MSSTTAKETPSTPSTEHKPGLFKRLYEKLDARMKAKAEAAEDCCCSEDDKTSGKKCC
jgi:hypothetical protein